MPVVAFFLFFFAYIVAAFYFTSLPFSSILPDSSSSPLVYSFSYSPVKFFRWAFTGLFFLFFFFFGVYELISSSFPSCHFPPPPFCSFTSIPSSFLFEAFSHVYIPRHQHPRNEICR